VIDGLGTVALGVSASLVASLGTAIGSAGIFLVSGLSRRLEDGLLSGAAGVMLAATFFSLLLPSLEAGGALHGPARSAAVTSAGVLLGALTLYLIHARVPHEHLQLGLEGAAATELSRIWLFVIAIALHNFPEGLAVGVSFAGGDWSSGASLTAGIAIQNMPEGLAVAVALVSVGYSKRQACGAGILSGLVEPLGGLLGAVAVAFVDVLVPWSLAFAAGAMLFIISDEIIPETHRGGNADLATFSLLGGFVLMMILDSVI
jgi:ZIP family zinc transporter